MEHKEDLSTLLRVSSKQLGIKLELSHIKMFLEYLEQLLRWNQTINLTSITCKEDIIIKHFIDSLAGLCAEPFVQGASLLDIGTGAGFPGIPLKIVRPDLLVTLVEPVMKKVSFLRFLIGFLRLKGVQVFEGTLQQFLTEPRSRRSFDYIVTRAVKYDVVANYCSYLLKNGGKAIFYLSKSLSTEGLKSDLLVSYEYFFELPRNLGKRVICIATPAGQ